ncbi:MAG: 3'-5' exonuclease [Cyanobacteria bacterium P01_F01_bin.53]
MNTFVALDFETADRGRDSACSIGLVRVEDNQIVHRDSYLIRPPRDIFEFTYIHGIRWADVAEQPTFGELWNNIEDVINGAEFLAAHNASFDKGVLFACCKKHQIAEPKQKFICTVKLARKIWNIYPTKLPNVCDFLDIKLTHHNAISDAEACARIVMASERFK